MFKLAAMLKIATTRETERDDNGDALGLSRCAIVTLLLLVSLTDRAGETVMTADVAAHRTGYTSTMTRRALHDLERLGYIVKERRSVYRIPAWVATPQDRAAREQTAA